MHRFFYPILILATLAAVAALVVPRDGSNQRHSVFGGGSARAQSVSDGGPRSQPYVDPGLLPRGPAEPVVATRPDTWPGGSATTAAQSEIPRDPRRGPNGQLLPPFDGPPKATLLPPAAPGSPEPRLADGSAGPRPTSLREQPVAPARAPFVDTSALDGAKVLARVGDDVILLSEIIGDVNEFIAANADKIQPGEADSVRTTLIQQRLRAAIEAKLLVVDAHRKVPAEHMPKIIDRLGQQFEEEELKKLLRRAGVESRADLDAKLRQQGTSLERLKRAWIEQQVAGGWLFEQVKVDKKEVTHEEMINYYRDHFAEYEFPAKARWEQLMVRFDRHPKRDEARRKLERLGNDVLHGASFAEVAKAHSEGPTAGEGGQFDWTSRGSLASSVLDAALFGLPEGRMSQILADDRGLYIIRVHERKEAGRKTFADVQSEIKKTIEQKRKDAKHTEQKEYLARLKREIPVWTIFDEAPGAAGATQAAYQSSVEPATSRPAAPEQPDRYGRRAPATPPTSAPPYRR